MAWPNFLYQQTDLASLCRDRPLYPTEWAVQNHLYGMSDILREYAGLPPGPLPWAMEHFISFDATPDQRDVTTRLPLVLAVSEGQAAALRRAGRKHVLAIGSCYHYVRRLFECRHPEPSPQRCGTIVFPDKSTIGQDVDYDRVALARRLVALPTEMQPVAVSVFWKDYLRGTYKAFEEAGLMLVSSGHSYDHDFLYRQYDLCRHFRYACANDLSTSFCMSVLAGCRFFHLPSGPLRIRRDGSEQVHATEPTLHLPGKRLCLAASKSPYDRQRQLELARRFSGEPSFRPPAFFHRTFELGERLLQQTPFEPRLDFESGGSPDRFASWRLVGVDSDGWSVPSCQFRMPANGYAVRGVLHIPGWGRPAGWTTKLRLYFDQKSATFDVYPGDWQVDIPPSERVELSCENTAAIDGSRTRAFRWLVLESRATSAASTVTSLSILPARNSQAA